MITTYTFSKKNNPSINYFPNTSKSTDYSKTLDDIILADVIKKNSYLFDTYTYSFDNSAFAKATKFLANYKKYKKSYNLPYILGKMYTLADGTPIIFYDDEIQIGFDTYSYDDFNDLSFLKNLTSSKKKIIINIFTIAGTEININLK